MIISKTPFRISFFGGGTDYPVWYREHGGAVLGAAINKYCYITTRHLPPFFEYKYRIRYTAREETTSIREIQHPSVRACLESVPLSQGVEILHTGDLPARSGLGSSSTFTVGLLNTLYALRGELPGKRKLALDAIHIEQNVIRENVGSQDQTFAAFGGLNKIEFGGPQEVMVRPVTIPPEKIRTLERHMMLFFTGWSRNASDIARELIQNTSQKKKDLLSMRELVEEAVRILHGQTAWIEDFGRLLHESWQIKRGLASNITTSLIDDIYDAARKTGAYGGKLLGAGGGGFMLFLVDPERQAALRERLNHLVYVPVEIDYLGSHIIYHTHQENYWNNSFVQKTGLPS